MFPASIILYLFLKIYLVIFQLDDDLCWRGHRHYIWSVFWYANFQRSGAFMDLLTPWYSWYSPWSCAGFKWLVIVNLIAPLNIISIHYKTPNCYKLYLFISYCSSVVCETKSINYFCLIKNNMNESAEFIILVQQISSLVFRVF